MTLPTLSDRVVKALAIEGLYVCNAVESEHYQYDVSGYRRVERVETEFGQFKPLTIKNRPTTTPSRKEMRHRRGPRYLNWMSGFHRNRSYEPEEIGAILSSAGIEYSDGPGNGLLESALICSKFGIQMMFQIPDGTSSNYYVENELSTLGERYGQALDSEVRFLKALGRVTGKEYVDDRRMLWVLLEHGDVDPLGLFVINYRRNPRGVAASFLAETGKHLSFKNPRNDEERIVRAELWEYMRRHFNKVLEAKALEIRKRMSGQIVSNIHFDTPLQYGEWGSIVDMPCVGIRPAIVDDQDVWRWWVGYATRLISDATRKLPIVSIRSNLGAAGTRRIPTAPTITYWHSQAVQNGARGFDFWTLDFPGDLRDPRRYFGPLNGNPDSTTLPNERWQATLDISRQISGRKTFVPPRSDLAVFVNMFGFSAEHWRRVFNAYCTLSSRRLFCNFVTDENTLNKHSKLSEFKLLIIPDLQIVRSSVLMLLNEFLRGGGTIVMARLGRVIPDKRTESELLGLLQIARRLDSLPRRALLKDGRSLVIRQRKSLFTFQGKNNIVAKYDSAKFPPAMIDKEVGSGHLVLAGFDIFNVVNRAIAAKFLEKLSSQCGCRDLKWVFDVTVNGQVKRGTRPRSWSHANDFPHYLYAHDEKA